MILGPDQIIACPKCNGLAKYMTLHSGNTFGACIWSDGKASAPMLSTPPKFVKCRHCAAYYWLAEAEKVGNVDSCKVVPHGCVPEPVNTEWEAAEYIDEPASEEYYDAISKGLGTTRQTERDLRVLAWWRWNDIVRGPGSGELTDQNKLLSYSHFLMIDYYVPDNFASARRVLDRIHSADLADSVRDLKAQCNELEAKYRAIMEEIDARHGHARPLSEPIEEKWRINLKALLPLLDETDQHDLFMKAEALRELGEFESAMLVFERIHSVELDGFVRQLQALCESGNASVTELRVRETFSKSAE